MPASVSAGLAVAIDPTARQSCDSNIYQTLTLLEICLHYL